jgi:hypothetical protein
MRKRLTKTVDGIGYERVDTSRFFKVKPRSIRSALKKLEFIHTLEVKDMFRSLTVDRILTDKSDARVLTFREGIERNVSYPIKTVTPTDYVETGDLGFNYPKFTPCKFIEQLRIVTEPMPTIKWID